MANCPTLILRVNGCFRAADAVGHDISGLSRRAQGLLAYLVTQPELRAERGLLADLLWSDRSEVQARASLRQELSVLRKLLPGIVDASRQHVWLCPEKVTRQAADGPFLEGFDLHSEGFEDWLRLQRSGKQGTPAAAGHPQLRPANLRPALAVLPFCRMEEAGEQIFADGIVEEITGALSRVHEFDVIARQSAFALRGQALGVPELAERLGCDYLVEGAARHLGDRVRISAQLVSSDGRIVWSERFEDRLDDLFALQDRIAARVAGQVSPSLRAAEIARARSHAPADRTAYELVLTALPHFWSHTRSGNGRALDLIERALAASPDYGPARAYQAWVLAQQACYMWSDDPARDRARAMDAARDATRGTGDHAPSLVAIGAAIALVSDEIDLSDHLIERALAIDPNNAWGWLRRGWNRKYSGRPEEARQCFDRAELLSPLDPFRFNVEFGRGATYLYEGDHEQALVHLHRGLALAPDVQWAHRTITVAYSRLGRREEAAAALRRLLDVNPGLTIRKVVASMPPMILACEPGYLDALRAAGLPEE